MQPSQPKLQILHGDPASAKKIEECSQESNRSGVAVKGYLYGQGAVSTADPKRAVVESKEELSCCFYWSSRHKIALEFCSICVAICIVGRSLVEGYCEVNRRNHPLYILCRYQS